MRPTASTEGQRDGSPTTRVAARADLEIVTRTIALAFADDPVWGPALSGGDRRGDLPAAFWRIYLEGALRYPWTWMVGRGEAVSVWIPPGGSDVSEEQEARLGRLLVEHLGSRAAQVLELMDRFETAHPRDEPHYYLTLLGTHPDNRGRGIGMALLAENLARIDGERMPAYLESTNPANNRRYEGVGFRTLGSFAVPGDGRLITTMWRPAGG